MYECALENRNRARMGRTILGIPVGHCMQILVVMCVCVCVCVRGGYVIDDI